MTSGAFSSGFDSGFSVLCSVCRSLLKIYLDVPFENEIRLLYCILKLPELSRMTTRQQNSGGEFVSKQLKTQFVSCGIKQHLSCPHTPQQNGVAERKHRYVTELGLSLMFQSKIPHQLWVEAFLTATYLGNLMPSSVLPEHKSPYEMLVGKPPVYSSMRVFGTSCYPYLRPYGKNKFDPKSLHCVFVGYSEKHKGYRCLHPPSVRVYISRHVLFEENNFPNEKEF